MYKYIDMSMSMNNRKKGTTLKKRIRANYIKFGLAIIVMAIVTIYIIDKNYKDKSRVLINTQDIYIEKATVISLNTDEDIVSILDRTGHVFEFKGIGNWDVDDRCMVAFGNNGTTSKKDDIILDVLYTQ
jgi:hypothetical protein